MNCFSDGVQYITGCTFGNNGLIFNDYGKNAFSLVDRNGRDVRIVGRNDMRQHINRADPMFDELFREVVVAQNHDQQIVGKFSEVSAEAAFGMLKLPFEQLFRVTSINVDIPPYAPV
jgi:formylmethanofuran dehydrogenase subunit E